MRFTVAQWRALRCTSCGSAFSIDDGPLWNQKGGPTHAGCQTPRPPSLIEQLRTAGLSMDHFAAPFTVINGGNSAQLNGTVDDAFVYALKLYNYDGYPVHICDSTGELVYTLES